jgi:uncharacterized protein
VLGSLTPVEIEAFIGNHCYAHLGCHAGSRTYVVPISYVYVGGDLIGQTKEGMKTQMLRENPQCCVQIGSVEGIADWVSVIAWGEYEELKGHEANEAMRLLIDRLSDQVEELESSRSPRDVTPGRFDQKPQINIVYRIKITEMTGRFESSK